MRITNSIHKVGIGGLFITALFSPCCFPLFAFAFTAAGLGTFELFGGWTMYIYQLFVLISVIGFYISYRKHKCMYPLMVAIPSAILIFYSYHLIDADYWINLVYLGMGGMLVATVINHYRNRMHNAFCATGVDSFDFIDTESTITCPNCWHKKTETMPTDACQYFYECENCKQVLKPKKGDCCVYCSYGTNVCPPMQTGGICC